MTPSMMSQISPYLSLGLFAAGVLIAAWQLIQAIQTTRKHRLAALRSLRLKPKWMEWVGKWREMEERSQSARKLRDKLQLAGYPWGLTIFRYQMMKLGIVIFITTCFAVIFISHLSMQHGELVNLLFRYLVFFALFWFGPDLMLTVLANRRKTAILFEISKFSHRLILCLTEKAELREVIMRAGRTMRELKPHLNELSIHWHKNQQEAILALGHQVGVTEIYPLVNTLTAVSNVESTEVAKMLEQQIDNIDKTLEHEIQKKIENAPLFIVFLIMIPFFVVFVLMIYPWIAYLSDQLTTSFGGGG